MGSIIAPLVIYGPKATEQKLDQLLDTCFLKREWFPYQIKVVEIEDNRSYTINLTEFEFFQTTHFSRSKYDKHKELWGKNTVVAYGMKVKIGDFRLVYSGDCGHPDDLKSSIEDCQLLLFEFAHHTANSVAKFAGQNHIPHLLLYHIHPNWDENPEGIVKAISDAYRGCVTIAKDGLRISL